MPGNPHRRPTAGARDDSPLVEGRDYTVEAGRYVFTARYLRSRGFCCFQGCRHCPWGQAGRSRPEVFADLQRRLDDLEARLHEAGAPVEVQDYRNGALAVLAPPEVCLTDRGALERLIRAQADGLLTVCEVNWL